MDNDSETLTIGFNGSERELLALLVGSIAGGGQSNPLHILSDQLDGRDGEIRDFLRKLYPVVKGRAE